MMNQPQTETKIVNGMNIEEAQQLVDTITQDYTKGIAKFRVNTGWDGGTKTKTKVASYEFGGKQLARNFTINTDEPEELFGTNTAANPQEILMAALNACMLVTYVDNASMLGIELEKIEIETEGMLDLRGVF
ncbi:MAG: OsmC family protein, partial [Halothece sp.]